MEVNFIVAICAGFAGTIYFPVFPAIFERKSFKVFIREFILSFIGGTIVGFIIAFLMRLM